MTLTHLDLFSGIGGFSLASGAAGFQTVEFVELDEFANRILSKHWPDVPIHRDIKTFNASKYRGKIDLLTAGVPCQSFSYAGKRKGKKDTRYLWPEAFGIIKQARPAYVLIENVAGVVNLALDTWQLDLANEGYASRSFEIPAAACEAHHQRSRIWLIGKLLHDADPYNLRKRTEPERQHEGSEDADGSFGDSVGSGSTVVADTGLSESSQRQEQTRCGEERQNTGDKTWDESTPCSGGAADLLADSNGSRGEQDRGKGQLRSGGSEQSSGDRGATGEAKESKIDEGGRATDSLSDTSSTGTGLDSRSDCGQGRQLSNPSQSAVLPQGDRTDCSEGSGAGSTPVADSNSKRHSSGLGAEVGGSDDATGEEAQSGSEGCSSSRTGDVADTECQSVRVQGHRQDAPAEGGVQGEEPERQRVRTDTSQCSPAVADTEQSGLEGLDEHRTSVSGGDQGSHSGDEGSRTGEDVSDTTAHRLQGSRVGNKRSEHHKKVRLGDGKSERTCPSDGTEDLSNANSLGLQGKRRSDHPQGRQIKDGSAGLCDGAGSGIQAQGSSAQSELGGSSARLSNWMDYPKRWADGTWEQGIPRVTTEKKNRVNRLKSLGNSVVPAVAYQVIKAIELDLQRERKTNEN